MNGRRVAATIVVVAAASGLGACREGNPPRASGSPVTAGHATRSEPPSQPDAASQATLDRIVRAETTLAYHGYRTITHGARGESRETRLRVVANGAGRTLLEWSGKDASETRRWTVDHRFPWVRRPELLLRNYHVRVGGAASPPVAWRETERVEIVGRRPGRPSLELLVDAETGLVLAETHRDAAGREWRSARFESLEYGAPPAADALAASEELETGEVASAAPSGWIPLRAGSVPEGFVRVSASVSSCGAWREDWSDGLAGFSLLQTPGAGSGEAGPGPADVPAETDVRRRRWLGGASLAACRGGVAVTVYGTLGDDDLLTVLRGLAAPVPAR